MSEHFHKRTTDEIHELLFDGKAVEWRDVLSIVSNMNETLIAVASSLEAHTREINARLDAQDVAAAEVATALGRHEKSEMEVFQQTIGGYKVFSRTVSIVALVIATLGGYILNSHLNAMLAVVQRVDKMDGVLQMLATDYKVLESTVVRNTGIIIELTNHMNEFDRNVQRPNIVFQSPSPVVPKGKK